jgi:hypothetical protein
MKHKYIDLQLFDDGDQGGAGAAAGTGAGNAAGAGNGGQNNAGGTNAGGSFSFAQAEEIANARAQRAERAALTSYFKQQGMSEQEVQQAITDFKAKQAAGKPDVAKITAERDQAQAELEAMKNAQKLTAKGVRQEDADYVLFKVGALMKDDSKLDFDKALDKYLKENPRYAGGSHYRVKTGADGSTQGTAQDSNDVINDAIRKWARR